MQVELITTPEPSQATWFLAFIRLALPLIERNPLRIKSYFAFGNYFALANLDLIERVDLPY